MKFVDTDQLLLECEAEVARYVRDLHRIATICEIALDHPRPAEVYETALREIEGIVS